ncbi:hypothetical protein [Flavisolibacter nicotianae]|uniref:hypothetical protein n=1 Tax=Flavisolibacter nicotianae TaxID=2364882 RepID=UPI000EAB6D2C|nr:hypothetical protein [Flavisolibacter nicotianae]
MNQLNHEAYNQLLKANQDAQQFFTAYNGPDWYELTYNLFTSSPLETMNDFWRIVAYTYSWMPTIPDVKAHLIGDPDALLKKLQALRGGDDTQLEGLFLELIPVINNSLVGVTKVLHFIAPMTVPIIDRHVLRGWDLFFHDHPEYGAPKLPSHRVALNKTHIAKYLTYRETLLRWVAGGTGQFTMRNLELAFFNLSQNTPEMPRVYLPTYND